MVLVRTGPGVSAYFAMPGVDKRAPFSWTGAANSHSPEPPVGSLSVEAM
jgi:hypothetical protein